MKTIQFKKANIISYLLLLYAGIDLFVVPYETFPFAEIFLPVILIACIFHKPQFNVTNIFISILIVAAALLNITQVKVSHSVYIILMLISINRQLICLNRKYIIFLLSAFFGSIVYQLSVYRWNDSRIVLSVGEPNFSGILMLLFLFISYKQKFKIGVILSVICIGFFISRTYMLSCLIFLLIVLIEKYGKQFLQLIVKLKFHSIIIFANLLLLVFSLFWVNNIVTDITYQADASRLISINNFNDSSNMRRFLSNYYVMNEYYKDFDLAMLGFGEEYIDILKSSESGTIVHSSFLGLIAEHGLIYCFFYFWAVIRLINQFTTVNNLKYIIPFSFYSLFLHGAWVGQTLIFFIIILKIEEPQKKIRYLTR